MSFFGFGAFSTPVGQLVERATDNAASAGNLGLHLEICDAVNDSTNGPKEAVAAIRKRLTGNSKNFHIINLTLTVLETCVKNCGERFHSKIAQKDFLSDLMKVIAVKNNPPTIVRERILGLIQFWADAFRGKPQLAAVAELYEQLKTEGIEFPPIDLDNLAPIETQGRTTLQLTQPANTGGEGSPRPQRPQQEHPPRVAQPPSGPLKPEQVDKLLTELDVVRKNMDIMNEIMNENEPGKESAEDTQLLDDLNRIVHSMQTRVAGLIERCSNEIVLESTLVINDDLNTLFVRYDRWLKNSSAAKTEQKQDTLVSSTGVATTNLIEPSAPEGISYPSLDDPPSYDTSEQLIDLGTDIPSTQSQGTDIISQLAQMGITADQPLPQQGNTTNQPPPQQGVTANQPPPQQGVTANQPPPQQGVTAYQPPSQQGVTANQPPSQQGVTANQPPSQQQSVDEFDMFAKSRTAYAGTGSTYADNMVDQNVSLSAAVHGRQEGQPNNPYGDLSDWLAQTDLKPETSTTVPTSAESATSAEFDQFLAQRATKGESLPAAGRPRPQMQKEEERSDELFQL